MSYYNYKKYLLNNNRNAGINIRTWHVIVVMIFMFLSSVNDAFATISSEHKNLLFLHSYFNNRHWGITGDTIDYDIPTSFSNLTPVKANMAGIDTNNIAAFSSSTGKLYLMRVVLEPPESFVSNYKMVVYDPVVSPVGSADLVFEIIAVSADNVDTVFLAFAAPSNKIAVHHIVTESFAVAAIDTLSIVPPSGECIITGLYGGPELAKGNQSCIWVAGTHGLIRFFSWDGASWSGETVYDIDTTDAVSAFCIEAVGTNLGKIYQNVSNTFVYNSRPCSTSINHITSTGAVCNDGIVLKKNESTWSRFNVGSTDYRYFNFVSRTDGAGIELLDNSWQYSIYTLDDTPTTFDITPAEIAQFINSGVYHYDGLQPETVFVHLIDPDGNCLVPAIMLNESIDLTDNGTQVLEKMHPDTECVPGFIELTDTALSLVLTQNSVSFSAKVRSAAFDVISSKYYWVYSIFQSSNSWSWGDRISIELGSQSLYIGFGGTTKKVPINNNQQLNKPITIQKITTGLVFNIPRNKVHSIRVFNLSGRQLASANISPDKNRVFLPIQASSGVVCIEYRFKHGGVQRNIIPIVR